MDFYQFLNHENVRVNSITPGQKNFIRENLELTNLEAIYVDKMNVIVVEYTFYNEEGIRMLGQYPIGEVM